MHIISEIQIWVNKWTIINSKHSNILFLSANPGEFYVFKVIFLVVIKPLKIKVIIRLFKKYFTIKNRKFKDFYAWFYHFLYWLNNKETFYERPCRI